MPSSPINLPAMIPANNKRRINPVTAMKATAVFLNTYDNEL